MSLKAQVWIGWAVIVVFSGLSMLPGWSWLYFWMLLWGLGYAWRSDALHPVQAGRKYGLIRWTGLAFAWPLGVRK